jgi:hypothetical protein
MYGKGVLYPKIWQILLSIFCALRLIAIAIRWLPEQSSTCHIVTETLNLFSGLICVNPA